VGRETKSHQKKKNPKKNPEGRNCVQVPVPPQRATLDYVLSSPGWTFFFENQHPASLLDAEKSDFTNFTAQFDLKFGWEVFVACSRALLTLTTEIHDRKESKLDQKESKQDPTCFPFGQA